MFAIDLIRLHCTVQHPYINSFSRLFSCVKLVQAMCSIAYAVTCINHFAHTLVNGLLVVVHSTIQ